MRKDMPDLSHLAATGTSFDVRVTPRAGVNRVTADADGSLRVQVTAAPEDGKANAAVVKLLSRAIGVAKSRLVLIRGQSARDKSFRVDP